MKKEVPQKNQKQNSREELYEKALMNLKTSPITFARPIEIHIDPMLGKRKKPKKLD